jgi:hypothetical protein
VTALEVVSYLLPPGVAEETSTFGSAPDRETFGEFFQRVSDELLWPRILVRSAPPQDEV